VADQGYDAPPFPGFRNQLFLSQGGQARWADATAALPGESGFSHSVTTGDVNGDGNVDIFVGNDAVGILPRAYVLFGNGAGGFAANSAVLATMNSGLTAAHLVDLDGDGLPELLTGMQHIFKANQVHWNGAGSYTSSPPTFLAEPVNFGSDWGVMEIQSIDLNGDGRQDVVLAYQGHVAYGGWQLQFLVNEGNRTFSDQTAKYLPYPNVVSSGVPTPVDARAWIEFLTPRDLNADGRTDFWITVNSGGPWTPVDDAPVALIQQPDSTFKPVTLGMLRAASSLSLPFVPRHFASSGIGGHGHLVSLFPWVDRGRAGLNLWPIEFTK